MKHFTSLLIGVGLFFLLFAFFSWGSVSPFNTQLTIKDVRDAIETDGLQLCSEKDVILDTTPGFTTGKTLLLSNNCATDANPMRVSILGFSSVEARNAAINRIQTTHRNGFGPHFAYVYGPYVITLEGPRNIVEQLILGQTLQSAGATP